MLTFLLMLTDEEHHDKIKFLYDTFHTDMLRFARHRLRQMGLHSFELDAEDVVQNAFIKIIKYIDRINLGVPNRKIKAYLLSIVVNECNDFVHEQQQVESIDNYEETLEDGDFFGALRMEQRYDTVMQAIGALEERYSFTLFYRYAKNMTVADIAQTMGVPEKTVYTRIERGKRLLLKLLAKEENQ